LRAAIHCTWGDTTLFLSLSKAAAIRRILTLLPITALAAAACAPQTHGWGGVAAGSTNTLYLVGGNQKIMAMNPTARARGDTFPADGEWAYPPENDRHAGTSFAAPVVANGTVYSSIYELGGTTGQPGAVIALDAANGQQRWRFQLPSASSDVIGPPVVVSNTVYLSSSDYTVYALDANTGAVRWQFRTGNKVWAGVTVDEAGIAYIASLDHRLYAVDAATGAEKWRFETGGAIAQTPAYKDGKLYFGSADGNLYSIDVRARAGNAAFPSNGEWALASSSWFWATPLIANATAYVTEVDGGVRAVDASTGKEKWATAIGTRDAGVSATPVLAGAVLAIPAQDGKIYALDPATGAEKWRYATDPTGPIYSTLSTDGTVLYAYSMNQRILSIEVATGRALWTCRTEQPCKG